MTGRARHLTGAATTVILAGMGLAFLTEGNKAFGIALVGMALFRGWVLTRQLGLFDTDDDDEERGGPTDRGPSAPPSTPEHE